MSNNSNKEDKIKVVLSAFRRCTFYSLLWCIFVISYCVPRVQHPEEERRFLSPDRSFEAIERYYAFGGAVGDAYYTIDIVANNKNVVRRPWLQTVFDYNSEVMMATISKLNIEWIDNKTLFIRYCGYYVYYRNYEIVEYKNNDIRISVEIEDICNH